MKGVDADSDRRAGKSTASMWAIRLEIGESVDKEIKNLLFDQQMVGGSGALVAVPLSGVHRAASLDRCEKAPRLLKM